MDKEEHQQYVLIWTQQFNGFDRTLLVLKDRPDWQKGRLNLPGGKIEPGETPEQAALRELKEETGYQGQTVRLMGLLQDGPIKIFCMKSVVTTHDDPMPRPEETEIVQWYSWHQVQNDERLMPNLRLIIPLIQASVSGWIIGDTYRSECKDRHTIKISVPTYMG